jgi:hypothetical protein
MFCKLEHMCYLNVQASITTENAYWLFVTAKWTWKSFSFFQYKVAQFEYEMVINLSFWKTSYIVILPK